MSIERFRITTDFYKGDNSYDICEVNGSKFALYRKPIEFNQSISIDLKDYNVVVLVPLEAEENISIKAISVIALAKINSKKGEIEIDASGKCIILGQTVMSQLKNKISGEKGVFFPSIFVERLEIILNEFKDGIANEHGPAIVDALVNTFDAVDDPYIEKEEVDMGAAFEFFNIPKIEL